MRVRDYRNLRVYRWQRACCKQVQGVCMQVLAYMQVRAQVQACILWHHLEIYWQYIFFILFNQFVVSEPPKNFDLRNFFFYKILFILFFCLIKNRTDCSKQSAVPFIKLFRTRLKKNVFHRITKKKSKQKFR
jgi:hypothetical protein